MSWEKDFELVGLGTMDSDCVRRRGMMTWVGFVQNRTSFWMDDGFDDDDDVLGFMAD